VCNTTVIFAVNNANNHCFIQTPWFGEEVPGWIFWRSGAVPYPSGIQGQSVMVNGLGDKAPRN